MNPNPIWIDFQQNASPVFEAFLTGLTHCMLVVSIVAAVIMILRTILRADGLVEKVLAWLSALAAALSYFLAKALHVPIPDVILNSIADHPVSLSLLFVAYILPGAAGVLSAFLINQAAERTSEVFERVMIFSTTLLVFVFTDVYASAVHQSHGFDPHLAPNGFFVLGMSLYWILRGRPRFGRPDETGLSKRR